MDNSIKFQKNKNGICGQSYMVIRKERYEELLNYEIKQKKGMDFELTRDIYTSHPIPSINDSVFFKYSGHQPVISYVGETALASSSTHKTQQNFALLISYLSLYKTQEHDKAIKNLSEIALRQYDFILGLSATIIMALFSIVFIPFPTNILMSCGPLLVFLSGILALRNKIKEKLNT